MITEPPYEVTEFGWGEFETRIQLHFHDAMEKPVDIIHMLVLYPPNNLPASTKKVGNACLLCHLRLRGGWIVAHDLRMNVQPVVSEFYDELVFNEPTEFFYKKLMAGPDRVAPPLPFMEHLPTYSDVAVQKALAQAQRFVTQEVQDTKDLLLNADIEIKELKERIAEHTKKKKQADKAAAAAAASAAHGAA